MKNSASITLLIVVLFSLLVVEACQKESTNPKNLRQKWQVVSMRRPNSTLQLYPVTDYILQFKTAKNFSFKLDVNNCEGAYTVSQPGKIKINSLSYTEICCDANIGQELASLLHHVRSYHIQEDILTLNGVGEIKLRRIK